MLDHGRVHSPLSLLSALLHPVRARKSDGGGPGQACVNDTFTLNAIKASIQSKFFSLIFSTPCTQGQHSSCIYFVPVFQFISHQYKCSSDLLLARG